MNRVLCKVSKTLLATLLGVSLLFGLMGCDSVDQGESNVTTKLVVMGGQKITSERKTTTNADTTTENTTSNEIQTSTKEEITTIIEAIDDQSNTETQIMVWIPRTGSKYHKKSTCSNMKNPTQVTKEEAISRGYDPCKKCY